MRTGRRRILGLAGALGIAPIGVARPQGAAWPSKPIRIIVPGARQRHRHTGALAGRAAGAGAGPAGRGRESRRRRRQPGDGRRRAQQWFESFGVEPGGETPEAFAALIRTEDAKLGEVIRAMGIKVE